MIGGVTYYIAEQGVPDHAQMKDKIDCVIEMIAMYLHHKHPDKPFGLCLPDLVLVGPAGTSGQILVRYYINHMFMCEFELESLLNYNSDTYGLACDLHTRCLDAESNFDYYLGTTLEALPNQQNLLGLDLADNADMNAIRNDGYTEWK